MRTLVMSLVVLGMASSAACHRLSGDNSKAAVQEAIAKHLKQRPSVASQNMTMELGEITFDGDTAQAQVKFRSKQAPDVAVGVLYKLRRVGNGWQVVSTSAATMPGTSPHENTTAPATPPSTNPADITPQPSH